MILIIADDTRHDVTPGRVYQYLQEAGADVIMVDSDAMRTGRSNLTLTWAGGRPLGGSVTLDGRSVPLADLRSVWLWRNWFGEPMPGVPEAQLSQDVRQFFRTQWRRVQYGLCLYLRQAGVFCVNPVPEVIACEEKVWQMELARSLGLTVPDTIITTDLAEARAFYDEHDGDIIYKTLALPMIRKPGEEGQPDRFATVFTNRVKREDLTEEKRFLPTPNLFQKRVEKQFEVRVPIMGNRAFAASINAQASEKANLDWRRYDNENTRYEKHTLPPDVEAKLIALAQRLGLYYGSADLLVTPEGEYVFLELNPNGQFLWLEAMAGVPLVANLSAMLMAASADYEQKV